MSIPAAPASAGDVRRLIADSITGLQAASESPRLDATLLLAHVLGVERSWLLARPEHVPDAAATARFAALLARRARGEPMAYLLGEQEFWSLRLMVSPDVLIPRPDTECLVEQALAVIDPAAEVRMADLGTGSGAVALAVASERPRARITATDASAAALAVAQSNVRRLGLHNVGFVRGDWLQPLAAGTFHCIASNPPYVAPSDPHLRHGGVAFEPRRALVANEHGLAVLFHLIDHARARLLPGGWLLLEHGYEQAAAVAQRLQRHGYRRIATVADLGGHQRVTLGQWPGHGATEVPCDD